MITAVLLVRAFAAGVLRPGHDRPPAGTAVLIDLNRAGIGELMALPGIGRGRAEAIVLHRVRHGPFAQVGDLRGVDGIGDETLAIVAPHAFAGHR